MTPPLPAMPIRPALKHPPTPQGWHPQEIIFSVRMKGTSLQRLSREHGFHLRTFNMAVKQRFPRCHDIIAAVIGVPRQSIWPQFYDEDGRVLHGGRLTRRRSA